VEYKQIFLDAYEKMDVDLINENCGLLCNYHCCRSRGDDGKLLGIYLLPFEYELMQKNENLINKETLKVHTNKSYELPKGIKKLYYGYCNDSMNCIRKIRPVQCRTFPFVPHIEEDKLYIVIEKNQEHNCPLINMREKWNENFEESILLGWYKLLEIDKIKKLVVFDSLNRMKSEDILFRYSEFIKI